MKRFQLTYFGHLDWHVVVVFEEGIVREMLFSSTCIVDSDVIWVV